MPDRFPDDMPPVVSRWRFRASAWHDAVLERCITQYPTCPFGCAKDGAPNCVYHVKHRDCPPSRAVLWFPDPPQDEEHADATP